MWVDPVDRPAALVGAAAKICAAAGGHLASERDYTEAVRGGLPNGSGAWIHSSDFAGGGYDLAVRWTAVDRGFTDQYSTYATWLAPGSVAPYRCVWTNELR
jgi:hypothetical protein